MELITAQNDCSQDELMQIAPLTPSNIKIESCISEKLQFPDSNTQDEDKIEVDSCLSRKSFLHDVTIDVHPGDIVVGQTSCTAQNCNEHSTKYVGEDCYSFTHTVPNPNSFPIKQMAYVKQEPKENAELVLDDSCKVLQNCTADLPHDSDNPYPAVDPVNSDTQLNSESLEHEVHIRLDIEMVRESVNDSVDLQETLHNSKDELSRFPGKLVSASYNDIVSTHSKSRPYSCTRCRKTFKTQNDLMTHVSYCEENVLSCDVCGKMFGTKFLLARHRQVHFRKRDYICPNCGELFRSEKTLNKHVASHSVSGSCACDTCGKAFKTPLLLKKHVANHIKPRCYVCDTCGKAFKQQRDLADHFAYRHSDERLHSCNQCGKAFKTRANLNAHLATHSKIKPHSCDQCEKTFRTRFELTHHLSYHHANERPFPCNQCEKAFKTKMHLEHHVATHSEERPYVCNICGKAFRTKTNILNHRIIHSEEMPHSCEYCDRPFKRRVGLRKHIARCHSEETPHSCDKCGKAFKTRDNLRNHLKAHSKAVLKNS